MIPRRDGAERMKLFAIGDTHLSLGVSKPMDVFSGWENYVSLLEENWRAAVGDGDTVVIPGDISWGIDLKEAAADLHFLDGLPGRKIILKGNHDLWWPTMRKLKGFLESEGITTITPLLHDAVDVGDVIIAGTRGWAREQVEENEFTVYRRETLRLGMALDAAAKLGEKPVYVFLHYPPVTHSQISEEIVQLLEQYGAAKCFYGHLHGPAIPYGFNGERNGIEYRLVSADALGFRPYRII